MLSRPRRSPLALLIATIAVFGVLLGLTPSANAAPAGVFTVAGYGNPYGPAGDNGPATNASFSAHHTAVIGDDLYIGDQANGSIRKVDANGTITTVPGTENSSPQGLADDPAGKNLYWLDAQTTIRRLNLASGQVDTVTTTPGGSHHSFSLDVDAAGNIYTASYTSAERYNALTDSWETLATGFATAYGIAVKDDGSAVYIADYGASHVDKIVPGTGIVTTVAGNGSGGPGGNQPAVDADIRRPASLELKGNTIYIPSYDDGRIRAFEEGGNIRILAGNGSGGGSGQRNGEDPLSVSLEDITDVSAKDDGSFYITERDAGRIQYVNDSTPPETQWQTTPDHNTNDNTADFTFIATEDNSTYECQVDGGSFDACTSPFATPALTDGEHTVTVRSTDRSGNTETTPLSLTFTVDTVAPDTSVASGPAALSSGRTPTFTFAASEPGVTYECVFEGAQQSQGCSSPATFGPLADGSQRLQVFATDAAGNTDPTAASYAWTVDGTAPAAPTILSGPDAKTTATTAKFSFSAEPGASAQCSFDGSAFAACTSPATYSSLKVGKHNFSVRAIDSAGNTGAARAVAFEVATDDSGPVKARKVKLAIPATAEVRGGAVAVGCKLDRGTLRTCKVGAYYRGKRVGSATRTFKGKTSTATVQVKFNRAGRKLVRRLGGARLTFKVRATDAAKRTLTSKATARVVPQRQGTAPAVGVFDRNSNDLNAAGRRYVSKVARQLRPAKRVLCVGHTSAPSDARASKALGLARAKAVCKALRRAGVKAKMRSVSAGNSKPRASNRTADGRERNRRIELRVAY